MNPTHNTHEINNTASAHHEQKYNHDHDHDHDHDHQDHDHGHDHSHDGPIDWKSYLPAAFSLTLLLTGLLFEHSLQLSFFQGWIKILWYVAAYLPVALPVLREAWVTIRHGEIFTEFFLMSIATIGAFAIGEYPEGVAVMVFYAVGELFQTAAVQKARGNIEALLDVRPDIAHVYKRNTIQTVDPQSVEIGEIIQVKVGEKIPLDGTLQSEKGVLNTAALTGESKPTTVYKTNRVMAGSINLEGLIDIKVEKLFHDSSIARILDMVQNATAKKAKTELLIRRLAKSYTPIVVYLAIAICFLPYFFVEDYVFTQWLYRALVFLVISCPCALVISIPLGYFGGLGAASKNGLLFKGAKFLDELTDINTLVFDKTGTVTKGVFKIKDIAIEGNYSEEEFMSLLMAVESKSTHPIAKAILEYPYDLPLPNASEVKEIAGMGLSAKVKQHELLVGNEKLLNSHNIQIPAATQSIVETIVLVAIDGKFAGYVSIADQLKADAKQTIALLQKAGIRDFIMLSGDKDSITQKVAQQLGIKNAKGGLLPEDKLTEVEKLKQNPKARIAFVGDGINDAPVLAASDVGIAMGAMGSDVAIETADVIIQTDQPSKIATGINIGKSTKKIIWQNIYLALGVKILVLIGGAFGLATMWQAVFADVGVALLAILNAIRLQRMKWNK